MILLQDLDLYPIIFTNEAQESRLKSTRQPDLSSNPSSQFFSHFYFSHKSLLSSMFITRYKKPYLKFRNWLIKPTYKEIFIFEAYSLNLLLQMVFKNIFLKVINKFSVSSW